MPAHGCSLNHPFRAWLYADSWNGNEVALRTIRLSSCILCENSGNRKETVLGVKALCFSQTCCCLLVRVCLIFWFSSLSFLAYFNDIPSWCTGILEWWVLGWTAWMKITEVLYWGFGSSTTACLPELATKFCGLNLVWYNGLHWSTRTDLDRFNAFHNYASYTG